MVLAHARAEPDVGDLASLAHADGVRFLLALFVDLTGKPCAKLVPVEAADELQDDGVGFAGYAVGAMGQQPSDPDLVAIPDLASYTPLPWVREGLALVHCDPHVEGEPWPFAPRVILKALIRRAAAQALEPAVGAEVEYFLVSRDPDGRIAPADARDVAARPCYDARGLTRMYDHLTGVSAAMNETGLGQLRQRPRGRERPVRAELRLRRRADHGRPGDHRPVPDLGAGRAARDDRDVHAQAVRRPHRQRAAPAPVAVAGRRGAVPRPGGRGPRRPRFGLSPLAYAFLAGDPRPRPGPAGRDRADGELLQAHRRDLDPIGRHLVAPAGHLRGQRPHPLRPDPRRPPDRAARRRRLGQPLPRDRRVARRRPRRDRPRPGPRRAGAAPRPDLPPTLLHAVDALPPTRSSAGALDAAGPGRLPSTSPRSSGRSSSTGTARSAPGRSTAT